MTREFSISNMGKLAAAHRQQEEEQFDGVLGALGARLEDFINSPRIPRADKIDVLNGATRTFEAIENGGAGPNFIKAIAAGGSTNTGSSDSSNTDNTGSSDSAELTALRARMEELQKSIQAFVSDNGGNNITPPDGKYDQVASLKTVKTNFERKLTEASQPVLPADMVRKVDVESGLAKLDAVLDDEKKWPAGSKLKLQDGKIILDKSTLTDLGTARDAIAVPLGKPRKMPETNQVPTPPAH